MSICNISNFNSRVLSSLECHAITAFQFWLEWCNMHFASTMPTTHLDWSWVLLSEKEESKRKIHWFESCIEPIKVISSLCIFYFHLISFGGSFGTTFFSVWDNSIPVLHQFQLNPLSIDFQSDYSVASLTFIHFEGKGCKEYEPV